MILLRFPKPATLPLSLPVLTAAPALAPFIRHRRRSQALPARISSGRQLVAGRPPTFSGVKEVLRNACGIHGRRNPLPAKRTAGISRRAAKPGFFPQKALFSPLVCSRQAKLPQAISTPRLGLRKNPRLAGLRAFLSYRRAIFIGHSVWVLFSLSKAGQPGMCRRWCQRKNAPSEDATFRLCRNLPGTAESRIPHALRLYEEKRVCTQLIRHLRGRRKAEPAWRREIKKRFCRLLGLWPKGGGRTHPCTGCTILFAAKPRRKSLFSRSAAAAGLQNRAAGYAAASNTTQQGR